MAKKTLLQRIFAWIGTNLGNSIVAIITALIGIAVTIIGLAASFYPDFIKPTIFITSIVTLLLSTVLIVISKKSANKVEDKTNNITPCPYITGQAVQPPHFVGRKRELQHLQTYLLSGESVALLGDRRIGKSSLLLTWHSSLRKRRYPVFLVNGQTQAGENLAALLSSLLQCNIAPTISADAAADQLLTWAKQQTLTSGKKPLILVDECEAIIQSCPHRFWERMRGGLGDIMWIFSSKRPLDLVYKQIYNIGSPFENQLKTLWLGLLDSSAATQLIRWGDFSPEQAQLLVKWAGCHPFYLQYLAAELWINKACINKDYATQQQALDAFKMASQRHLDDLWQSLKAADQQRLKTALMQHKPLDNSALRSRGIITAQGQLFAHILNDYLTTNLTTKV